MKKYQCEYPVGYPLRVPKGYRLRVPRRVLLRYPSSTPSGTHAPDQMSHATPRHVSAPVLVAVRRNDLSGKRRVHPRGTRRGTHRVRPRLRTHGVLTGVRRLLAPMWPTEFAKPTGPAVCLFVCLLRASLPSCACRLPALVCVGLCVRLVQLVRLFLVRSFVRSFVPERFTSFRMGLPWSISRGFVFYNLFSSAVTGVHHGR